MTFVRDVTDVINESAKRKALYQSLFGCGEVITNLLIKLCLAVPTSVAASERSFSSLRRLKNWLRNTMTQERLTHLALMNAHKEILDAINVQCLMREFVSRTSERRSTFGHML